MTQKDLFDSGAVPERAPMPTAVARGPQLTPQQQAFNRLVARIDKLTRSLAERQQLADAHRVRHVAVIEPLRRQQHALNRTMVLFLDGRLRQKGWTRSQKRTMKEILCTLAQPFIVEGDAEMLALHDRHSKASYAEQNAAALAEASALMEDMLGVSLDRTDGFASVDELVGEGLRQAQDKSRSEAEARQQARTSRRKPGKRQQQAVQAEAAARLTLREVYRKLASALHPDRELDTAERDRKTALMSEVNTAYARRDLLALLQLQLRIDQGDAHAIGQWSKEKLGAMTALLKEQAADLEHALLQLDDRICAEFELPWGEAISVASLTRHLNVLEHEYQRDIRAMQHDLQRIDDDQHLRHWLKAQQPSRDAPELADILDLAMFVGRPPRRR